MAEKNSWQDLSIETNEIRLLTIEPADQPEKLLACHLTVVSLDKNPQYEALSYVWGDTRNIFTISLNGQTWPVRKNLYYALRSFRLTDVSRTMFVDALCINQDNIPEKSAQVPLMSRIYSQASCVRCWLGLARPHDVHAIEMLRLNQLKTLSDKMVLNAQITLRRDIKALIDLFMRPYWDRVWIVQEIVLAFTAVFHCGRHCFEWDLVTDLGQLNTSIHHGLLQVIHNSRSRLSNTSLENIKELSDDVEELGHVLMGRLHPLVLVKSSIEHGNFLIGNELVYRLFSIRAATLPQDHVYASLGLLLPDLRKVIVPDYGTSVSLVYGTFALECMKSMQSPDLLYTAISLRPTVHKLSSRVPDYSQNHVNLASYSKYFMANDEVGWYFDLNDRGILEIGGCYLDEIVAHCPCDEQGRIDWEVQTEQEYHRRWRKFFNLPELPEETVFASAGNMTTGTLENAYWATLARSHCLDPATNKPSWLDADTVTACKLWLRASLESSNPKISTEVQERVHNYHKSIVQMDASHLFRTRNGYFGVTHRSTSLELGYYVFLIAGMACPCILRPSDRSSKELVFKFVTTSYVHGAMLRRIRKEHISKQSLCQEYIDDSHPHATPKNEWYRILLD